MLSKKEASTTQLSANNNYYILPFYRVHGKYKLIIPKSKLNDKDNI